MAYIDVDKFAERICNFQAIEEDAANKMIWLLRTFPTADVVSKSEVERWRRNLEAVLEEIAETRTEVAREIFAELETKAPFFCENQIAYDHFNEELADLKKKYTNQP